MKKLFSKTYLIIILLFLYLPIAVLIFYSFNDSRNQYQFSGFTLDWYKAIFDNYLLQQAVFNSLTIAFIATISALIIGVFASIGIVYANKKLKRLFLSINNIPIINPDIVTGLSLAILFVVFKIKFGYNTMLLAHISFTTPFVIITILPKLTSQGVLLVEAALDLGMRPIKILYKVILPTIKDSMIIGGLIAFTMSIDDFVISYFTTGNGVNNLSIWIFSQTKKGLNPTANAVSTLMFLIVLIILIIVFYKQKDEKGDFYEIY